MSWDSEVVLLLRNYVGDTSTTAPKYTDDSLASILVTAAQFVIFDAPLKNTYIANVENPSLSPDPTSRATSESRDDAFINLMILKSVWMLCNAELRVFGAQAIGIRDGTSAVDLKRDMRSLNGILRDHEKAYFEYKNRYIREANHTGRVITSPMNIFGNQCGPDYFEPLTRNRW